VAEAARDWYTRVMADDHGDRHEFLPVATQDGKRRLAFVLAGAVLFGIFLLIGELTVRHHPWWAPDRSGSHRVFDYGHDHAWLTTVSEWVGHLTVPTALRVLTLICAVLLWRRGRRAEAIWWSLAMIIGGAIAIVLREIVARPRPHWPGSGPPVEGYTFPSGHAASAALFAGCVLIVAWPHLGRAGRAATALAAALFTVLVGVSRLLLGVHSILDVVAAWVLAAVILLVGLAVVAEPRVRRGAAALPAKVGVS
jgi:membrane-associated phospholipid phosphatase